MTKAATSAAARAYCRRDSASARSARTALEATSATGSATASADPGAGRVRKRSGGHCASTTRPAANRPTARAAPAPGPRSKTAVSPATTTNASSTAITRRRCGGMTVTDGMRGMDEPGPMRSSTRVPVGPGGIRRSIPPAPDRRNHASGAPSTDVPTSIGPPAETRMRTCAGASRTRPGRTRTAPRGMDPSASAPRTSRRQPAVPGRTRTGARVTTRVATAASTPATTILRSITVRAAPRRAWPGF